MTRSNGNPGSGTFRLGLRIGRGFIPRRRLALRLSHPFVFGDGRRNPTTNIQFFLRAFRDACPVAFKRWVVRSGVTVVSAVTDQNRDPGAPGERRMLTDEVTAVSAAAVSSGA